jgi:hypothetical protein
LKGAHWRFLSAKNGIDPHGVELSVRIFDSGNKVSCSTGARKRQGLARVTSLLQRMKGAVKIVGNMYQLTARYARRPLGVSLIQRTEHLSPRLPQKLILTGDSYFS